MASNEPTKRRMALFRNNFLPYSETFIHDQLRHHVRYDYEVFARQKRNTDRFVGHTVHAVESLPESPNPVSSALYAATVAMAHLSGCSSPRPSIFYTPISVTMHSMRCPMQSRRTHRSWSRYTAEM